MHYTVQSEQLQYSTNKPSNPINNTTASTTKPIGKRQFTLGDGECPQCYSRMQVLESKINDMQELFAMNKQQQSLNDSLGQLKLHRDDSSLMNQITNNVMSQVQQFIGSYLSQAEEKEANRLVNVLVKQDELDHRLGYLEKLMLQMIQENQKQKSNNMSKESALQEKQNQMQNSQKSQLQDILMMKQLQQNYLTIRDQLSEMSTVQLRESRESGERDNRINMLEKTIKQEIATITQKVKDQHSTLGQLEDDTLAIIAAIRKQSAEQFEVQNRSTEVFKENNKLVRLEKQYQQQKYSLFDSKVSLRQTQSSSYLAGTTKFNGS